MSFPNVVWGSFGDEKITSSTKIGGFPLGVRMITPDGCEYVHAKVSATAGIAGNLYQVLAGIQGSDAALRKDGVVAADSAIGDTTVQVTAGATTAVTANQFQDGILFVNDVTGQGHKYRIKSNNAAAASSTLTLTLYNTDPIKVALVAGSSEVGVRENPFYQISITTADTVRVGSIAGILPTAVTANHYCWVQRRGEAAALTDGTLVIGTPVVQSAALAGAVSPHTAATTNANLELSEDILGYTLNVAASTEYSLVYLKLA